MDPTEPLPPPQTREADWFRRFPNGGTAYVSPPPLPSVTPLTAFRMMPTGGATVFVSPEEDGHE